MSQVSDAVSLVSFLVANPGIRLRDAAKATHRTPAKVVEDLERLLMCGVPPYSPSDYISYRLDGSGDRATIQVQFAQHFARPLNFTPQEAVALKYALEHFRSSADKKSAVLVGELTETLKEALHGRVSELISENSKGFVTPRQTDRMRELMSDLSQSAADRRVTEIEYYSAHRARLATRKVYPFAVLEIGAHFYLYAWCELADDTRHFRLDRIRQARVLVENFEEPRPRKRKLGKMESLFQGRPKDRMVVRFSKVVAREVIDEWENSPDVTIRAMRDGRAEIETPLYNPFWAIGFVMGYGEHAELLKPGWLRDALTETIKKSLNAHT